MSESDWTPVHHVQAEEPEGEAEAKPQKSADTQGKGSQVTLVLNLPDDVASAISKLVKATEENTKEVRNLIKLLTKSAGGSTSQPS